MKLKLFLTVFLMMFVFFACSKKEKPNAKFIGTYQTSDSWGSSKPEIGSGSLEYVMTIKADGEDGEKVILSNVNKTLDGVKGTIKGDSLIIEKQTAKSNSGKTYQVDNAVGTLSGNTLKIEFGYDDLDYGNAIGYIFSYVSGIKAETKKE